MKNKKYLKILIVILSLGILLVCILFESPSPLKERVRENLVPIESKVLLPKDIKVTLEVLDKKYDLEVKDNANVFEVMQKGQKESKSPNIFNFKYKEHAGLGVFIEEINGIKGGEGRYWIYYVNGVLANVGVSNYKINNGDIISWKYEK
jgi:hypothetical protein